MYDILCQIKDLTAALKSANELSILRYKPENVKRKLKFHCKWTPDKHAAIRECRRKWGEWKAAGQPDQEAAPDYFISMKSAKTNLGKVMRQTEAKFREDKMRNIMNCENNSKSFHTLVRMQRKSSYPQTISLVVGHKAYESVEGICSGWREHLLDLSTPKENTQFDSEYRDRVKADLIHTEEICRRSSSPVVPTSEREIIKALKNLKNE